MVSTRANSLAHNQTRHGLTMFPLLRRLNPMGCRIHRKAVNYFLDREILTLSIVNLILCLEHRSESTGTSDIDSAQAGIKFHNVGADWHGQPTNRISSRLTLEENAAQRKATG